MGYTSPTKKAAIVAYKRTGLTDREVATRTGVNASTVNRIFRRYSKTEAYHRIKPKPGRPCLFTDSDLRQAIRLLGSGKARDATDLQKKYFPTLSPQTIRKRLKLAGYKAYKPRHKPFLTPDQVQKRFQWAKEHEGWTVENWKQVVFSDESKFNLFGSDGRE